jgi:hypothetical protein
MAAMLAALARDAITPFEFAVGVALSRFADNKTGKAWPSIRAIAEKVGAKVHPRGKASGNARGVSKAVAALKREGLLAVTQRYNTSSVYLLKGGLDLNGGSGQTCTAMQTNSVSITPPMTKSGISYNGRGDNRPPIVLDGEMRKIAIDEGVPEYDHRAQFDKLLAGDKPRNPKAAWRAWCNKCKRDSRDFEGNPMWGQNYQTSPSKPESLGARRKAFSMERSSHT